MSRAAENHHHGRSINVRPVPRAAPPMTPGRSLSTHVPAISQAREAEPLPIFVPGVDKTGFLSFMSASYQRIGYGYRVSGIGYRSSQWRNLLIVWRKVKPSPA